MNSLPNTCNYKIKILDITKHLFPYFFSDQLLAQYFIFVESSPDIILLPVINELLEKSNTSKEYWSQHFGHKEPYVIFHTLDEFENRSIFSKITQEVCNQCNLIFGHQLPISLDQTKYIPIMYPSLRTHNTFKHVEEQTEIFFWGAYDEIVDNSLMNNIPNTKRERIYRGAVIQKIIDLQKKYHWSLDIKKIYFWKMTSNDRHFQHRLYLEHMEKSKLCLSLYGFGYNSFRTTEVFSLKKALISPETYKHVLLPDIELWRNGELGFFFSDDCSDLENLILKALSDTPMRKQIAHNGYIFYKRHCTPEAIIKTVYSSILKII